jgi:hypothetical protein
MSHFPETVMEGHGCFLPGKFMEDDGRAALPFFIGFGKGRKECCIMRVKVEKMDKKSAKSVRFLSVLSG